MRQKQPTFVFILLLMTAATFFTVHLVQQRQDIRKEAVETSASTSILAPIVLFSDSFETDLSNWNINQGQPPNSNTLSSAHVYHGNKSLLQNYVNGAVSLKKNLPISTNVLVRVFFYDSMDTSLGTIVQIDDANESDDILTFIGVKTSLDPNHYVMRIKKGPSSNLDLYTYSTDVQRSLGWHMFELITIDDGERKGTFAKIDNKLLRSANNWNPNQTTIASVAFYSTWDLAGQAHWDELTIIKESQQENKLQLWLPVQYFWDYYKNVNLSNLYSNLGLETHSNDLRSVFGTALSFYLLGKQKNDLSIQNKGKQLFTDALSYGHWESINKWSRGATMISPTLGAYYMWSDLDSVTRELAKKKISDQANAYFNSDCTNPENHCYPESGYIGDTKAEENAWHAAFLALAANLFPNLPNTNKWEERAKCFAYHSITTSTSPAYCGIKSQTVHDDFKLENHNKVSPMYAAGGVMRCLAIGALSYSLAGKPIPSEFYYNYENLYNHSVYPNINFYHYHYLSHIPQDWSGAYNSLFLAPAHLVYMDKLGLNHKISWGDFLGKRDIFYYQIPAVYTKPLEEISTWNQSEENNDSYKWFINTVMVAEDYIAAILLEGLYSAPTPTLKPTAILTPKPTITSTPKPTPTPKPGDITSDGKVNEADYAILIANIGKTGNQSQGDLTGDGKINEADYAILMANFGK